MKSRKKDVVYMLMDAVCFFNADFDGFNEFDIESMTEGEWVKRGVSPNGVYHLYGSNELLVVDEEGVEYIVKVTKPRKPRGK